MGNSAVSTYLYEKESALYSSNQITIQFKVHAHGTVNDKSQHFKFTINALYSHKQTLKHILDKIVEYVELKQHPLKVCLKEVTGFAGFLYSTKDVQLEYKSPVTKYSRNEIKSWGLDVKFEVIFKHGINAITCRYMTEINSENPMKCPFYSGMMKDSHMTLQNLSHLYECRHFINETEQKPACDFSDECKTYIRCLQGGSKLDDMCHMKLYRHPPRASFGLPGNMHAFIFNKQPKDNRAIYDPNNDHHLSMMDTFTTGRMSLLNPLAAGPAIKGDPSMVSYKPTLAKNTKWSKKDGYLEALIDEVVRNGFKYDLCSSCTKDDECTHDKYSILTIVDEKMKHKRHKLMDSPLRRDHMLALVLYTGCDCNYDLCKSQRNNKYEKWHYFDLCLYNAILNLSKRESGRFSLYSGLKDVHMKTKIVRSGFFPTYVSTSWREEIAFGFIGGNDGMLMQIDAKYKKSVICCDVSWISKFPDECEILISRSWDRNNGFECVVVDNMVKVLPSGEKKIQIVALKTRDPKENLLKDDGKEVLDEALYEQLFSTKFNSLDAEKTLNSLTLLKKCKFEENNDNYTNGIIYYIGTRGGENDWVNPGVKKWVSTDSSTIMKDSQSMNSLCGRTSVRCVTKPLKNQWMKIDLKHIYVMPTHYSLRHYLSYDTEALRNWVLEASFDGSQGSWIILRTHVNDESLNHKGAVATWKLESKGSKYRCFRIRQTGLNSNRHYYLACSGFEIYGDIYNIYGKVPWEHDNNKIQNEEVSDEAFSKAYENLMNMGFDETLSLEAANIFGENMEQCVEYIVSRNKM